MNEDDDEIEGFEEGFEDDSEDLDFQGEDFDSFDKDKKVFAEGLRDKPLVKLGIIAFVILFIIGLFMFLRDDVSPVVSSVPTGADITAPPGTTEVSPAIRDAIEEADEQRREEAERNAGSALPTLIEPPVGRIQLPEDENVEEDPLQRWRRLQEERLEREAERARLLQPDNLQEQSISPEQIKAMADAMAAQMEVVLSGKKVSEVQHLPITSQDYLQQIFPQPVDNGVGASNDTVVSEILVPAGQIVYAQLLTEANSDVPGPVLAQINSGPLRGARVLGAFNVQDELLTLAFSTIVLDGISYSIDAVALDPSTTLPGMATEVDHRYLKRIVLPAAAAFIEGTADAIASAGTTTVTISGDTTSSTTSNDQTGTKEEVSEGVREAAQEVGDLLEDIADKTNVLVKIHAGTPMGLLFLQPVLKN